MKSLGGWFIVIILAILYWTNQAVIDNWLASYAAQ